MSNEHKRAPGFARRPEDAPKTGHSTRIDREIIAGGVTRNVKKKASGLLDIWPYDHRPTSVPPREILKAARPPEQKTHAARLRALARLAAAVLYLAVFVASVWGLIGYFTKAGAETPSSTWLVANLGSYHPDRAYAREHELTGVNPGLGVEYGVRGDLRLVGGAYRNSYRQTSVYAGGAWQPIEILGARVGVLGGLVNGYPVREGRFGPFAGLVASVEIGRAGFNIVALPKVRDKAHGAIALQLKWGL